MSYTITGITQATTAVVTVNATGSNPFSLGNLLAFASVVGMTQINGENGTCIAIGGSSGAFTATVNINSSAYTAYSSGGTVTILTGLAISNLPTGTAIGTSDIFPWDQGSTTIQQPATALYAFFNKLSAAETTAGITPSSAANYVYPPLNVLRYGADPTGGTSSQTAFANAVAVANVSGGTITVPAGTFSVTGVTITSGGVRIQGQGPTATTINVSGTSGTCFAFGTGTPIANIQISDLTINYASAQTSGTAIVVYNAYEFYCQRVRINSPYVGLQINTGAIYYIDEFDINHAVSAGIIVGASSQAIEVFFNRMEISLCGGAGLNLVNVSGCYVQQCDFIECLQGISTYPANGQEVTACFFDEVLADTSNNNGWQLITNGGEVSDINIVNCWSASNGTAMAGTTLENGIWIDQGTGTINGVTISSTRILNNKGAGIQYDSGVNVDIADCQIECNSQVGALSRSGIEIEAGVSHWSVRGGRIGLSGHLAVYTGYNNQYYAINISTGSSDYYSIMGVDVQNAGGTVTGNLSILDGGSGVHKAVSKNIGYNPIAQKSVSLPAAPSSYTFINETGDTVILQVTGGTVSNIQVGNATWTTTDQSITLPHNLAAVITYSALPTVVYYGT